MTTPAKVTRDHRELAARLLFPGGYAECSGVAKWVQGSLSGSGKRYEEPKSYLVPDVAGIPQLVERTLTRLFGRPDTIDRGEVAYWVIPAAVVSECEQAV